MSDQREHIDVSRLPSLVFDHHNLVWWGTLGFIMIEGFTIVLAGAAYLYLRLNMQNWPPGRTPDPDLIVPTINLILLLLIMVPMRRADRAARHFDKAGVIRYCWIAAAMAALVMVLRWWELVSLNVRYDAHAYASIAWGIVILHTTLVVVDTFETATLAWMFQSGHAKMKHFMDTSDATFYQYFLSLGWIPFYLLVYWGPRIL